MTYKWIRKFFLITISFLVFGIIISCNNQNTSSDDGKFAITFNVTPIEGGRISATTAKGDNIGNGARVESGTEIVFVFIANDGYTIDSWEGDDGLEKDNLNPLIARLKVSKSVNVTARLMTCADPKLTLKSLAIYHKPVDIKNLDDVKIEVENYVQILSYNDIEATFTCKGKTEPYTVNVDKEQLEEKDTLVLLSIPAVKGKYAAWVQKVKITRKQASPPVDIPIEVQAEDIEIALFNTKKVNGVYNHTYQKYTSLVDFEPELAGPYSSPEDAKTAYVAIRLKKEKPSNDDYEVKVTNTTTYLQPLSFRRLSGKNASYLECKNIVLSKGRNILEIKVESKNPNKEGTYTVIVNYAGGPDLFALDVNKRKILSGVYCPAQRKPLEGESPDYVWVICIAGW